MFGTKPELKILDTTKTVSHCFQKIRLERENVPRNIVQKLAYGFLKRDYTIHFFVSSYGVVSKMCNPVQNKIIFWNRVTLLRPFYIVSIANLQFIHRVNFPRNLNEWTNFSNALCLLLFVVQTLLECTKPPVCPTRTITWLLERALLWTTLEWRYAPFWQPNELPNCTGACSNSASSSDPTRSWRPFKWRCDVANSSGRCQFSPFPFFSNFPISEVPDPCSHLEMGDLLRALPVRVRPSREDAHCIAAQWKGYQASVQTSVNFTRLSSFFNFMLVKNGAFQGFRRETHSDVPIEGDEPSHAARGPQSRSIGQSGDLQDRREKQKVGRSIRHLRDWREARPPRYGELLSRHYFLDWTNFRALEDGGMWFWSGDAGAAGEDSECSVEGGQIGHAREHRPQDELQEWRPQ